jgi:AcrR family transcriptional regulator
MHDQGARRPGAAKRKTAPGASEPDSRHAALIDEASMEFNRRGLSHTSMARIARNLGLGRSALYYYVKDLDDLLLQCYRHSCAVTAADLVAADSAADGFGKLEAFIRRALDPHRKPIAVLSEIDYLEGEARKQIVAANGANVGKLRVIVRDGIDDGSIRPCDDEVVAQTVAGLLAWVPLSADWVNSSTPQFRARTVAALIDLIAIGEATHPEVEFRPTLDIAGFFQPPASAFDRPAIVAAKVEELLRTASELFNRRGIDATSLDDITQALGATKGTLYHYLDNKTDLVVRCYRRAFSLYERFTDAAGATGKTGLERSMAGLYLNVQAHTSGLSPLIEMVGVHGLPAPVRNEVTRRARALQRRYEVFGLEGQADGSIRAVDSDALALIGAGAFEWLPKWLPPSGSRVRSIAAMEIVALVSRGIRGPGRSPGRRTRGAVRQS